MTSRGYGRDRGIASALRTGVTMSALLAATFVGGALSGGCGANSSTALQGGEPASQVPDGVDAGNGTNGGGGDPTVDPSDAGPSEPTGDDDASTDGPSTLEDAGPSGSDAAPPVVACNPIVEGKNTLTVNGTKRTFLVQLPKNTSRMALLFLWHGWMTDPAAFANEIVYDVPAGKWVPFDPNAFPMPLLIITPVDTKMLPPFGLDWDIRDGSKDFPYFEAMLKCAHDQFTIEDSRIYSFGFSAGAVFTDLLSAKYPKTFAATISESGMWYNDKSQWSDVKGGFIMSWDWPAFNPADRGNVLLTHGGEGDYATVADLESANKKAVPFLHDNNRTVVECSHTFGHTLDPDLTQSMYYDYMWSHTLGGPPLSALVPSFPTPEHKIGSTGCVFHPAP